MSSSAGSIDRKVAALRVLQQRSPAALRRTIARSCARRRRASAPGRLALLQRRLRAALYQRRLNVNLSTVYTPKLLDPARFARQSYIGDGPPSAAVPPGRDPALLMRKMEAAKQADLRRRQLAEEARQAQDAAEAEEVRQRMELQLTRVRKSAVRQSFLRALFAHGEAFRAVGKEETRVVRTLASQALQWIIVRERRIRSMEDKQQKARMKALKENDMEAYAALLADTKNTRLTNLLQQTEDFLRQLGAMAGGSASNADDGTPVANGSQFHSVVEEITAQPLMLKFGKLKEYQITGLQWLVSLYNNNLNGILADEMGLGKTIQTIALLSYVMETKGDHGPFMIIVPLSTMSNWVKEFERWAPSIMVVEYQGKPPERKDLLKRFVLTRKFNVLLTTYEYILNKHDRSKLEKIDWHYIIVDEGHRMKNTKSKFTVALNTRYTSLHRLLLTGTPLQNNLSELWSLLNFLVPNIFNSADNFETWFNKPFEAAGVSDSSAELQEEEKLLIINRLHRVLRPFLLRRLKTEVATELPDKVERVVKCALSVWQKQVYKQIQMKFIPMASSGGETISAKGLNNTFMQLRKICNHPYLFFDDMNYDWDRHKISEEIVRCSGKFEILDRMLPKIQKSGHKALIFTQMTRVLDIMEDYMELKKYRYLRLDGQTKPESRSHLLELYNDKDSPFFLFLLSTRAGGLGLNLQSADTVIIFDSDWNPQMDLQAQDRAHRIGQQNEVRVFRLVTCSPVEEQILERAQFKLGLDQLIIQGGQFNQQESSDTHHERRQMLKTVLREGVEMGEIVDLPSDERLNRLLARGEDEFDMFQLMDAQAETDRRAIWRASGHQGQPPPRLMTDPLEMPEYLRVVSEVAPRSKHGYDDAAGYGRGIGRRTDDAAPVYTDMSESAFSALLVDEDDEPALASSTPINGL